MIEMLLLLGIAFLGIYLNVWFLLVASQNKSFLYKKKVAKSFPKTSLLIPAYNEEKSIARCLSSIMKLDYPRNKIETIVIENGSKDNTAEEVKKFKWAKLIRIPQANKAIALNHGLKIAKGEIIGIVDADTIVEKSTLKKMIGYFDDKEVGAVTNFIKIDRRHGIISRFQELEYLMSAISKKILSLLDSFYIVPGTLSLVRKELADEIKFSSDTLTEDMDFALSLLKKNYKIVTCLDATVRTVIPKTLGAWMKQRVRWYRGYFENSIKHKDVILSRKYITLGWFVLPIAGYSSIGIGIYLTFLSFFNLLHSLLISLRSMNYIPLIEQINLAIGNLPKFNIDLLFTPYAIVFFAISIISSLLVIFISLNFAKQIKKRNIYIIPFYMFVYYTLIMINWFASLVLELARRKKKW